MVFAPRDADAGRFGIGELNATGQIINFIEKPEFPRTNLASCRSTCFKKEVLVEELRRAVSGEDQTVTFQIHEVLRRMISRRRAYGFIFRGTWSYSRTLANTTPSTRTCWERRRPWTLRPGTSSQPDGRPRVAAAAGPVSARGPHRKLAGLGGLCDRGTGGKQRAVPGCAGGATGGSERFGAVERRRGRGGCTGVRCHRGQARGVRAGCQVGVGESVASEERPTSLSCGASVLAMNVRLPAGARVGKNCLIHVDATPDDIGLEVPSGKSVWPAATGKPVRP